VWGREKGVLGVKGRERLGKGEDITMSAADEERF
jgi:hypothetical protein